MNTIEKLTTTDKIFKLLDSNSSNHWGEEARVVAKEAFLKQGIPSRKHEEYRYLNLELLLKDDFLVTSSKTLTCDEIAHTQVLKNAIVIVIENGKYVEGHSKITLPKGLKIIDISKASSDVIFQKQFAKFADVNTDAFIAMNTAFATGGVFVHVEKNAIIEQPIHIIHISAASESLLVNVRNLIVVEENAQAKFIESFETILPNTVKIITNALTEILVQSNAIVEHNKIQNESKLSGLINTTQVYQKKKSVFTTNNFTLSGSFVRNNLNIVLDDEYIESHLNGLYLTRNNQTVDNHTLVDHRKPNCNSNELYKGIIDDKSSATFNGKVYVRKDAQKTNAFQSNKNILLSDDGTINTKPQLEIYADDVKCSHGTSTGKLDEDKIFYLRARGLSEASAKKLLMHAFASEVVEFITIEELKNYIETKISERFE
ncbi:MAG: Fe-S cluster assembly protein SufD [Bacteroidia bacterium]|nr:Fe-S cluster assembly protein SufD [Bacteroidia bacterium]